MNGRAFVGIGANLGDAVATVRQAILDIQRLSGTSVAAASSLYRSQPVDAAGPDFINAVVEIRTRLDPFELLSALQQLEADAGRERPYRNAPRTLDLDLLMYSDVVLQTPRLTLPHPRMRQRAFVLVPLAELAPELVSVHELDAVRDQRIDRLA
jgi:2-amino-4-hydroxy-6-hydroxymethyldihydropteridine diphosphokinase